MYQPLQIGRRFCVLPPGQGWDTPGSIPLFMLRGPFGSGLHETTASCLEILEKIEGLAGSRVLDLGCGTGILAIAVLKLGAREAQGIDINPEAVAVAAENRRHNELEGRLELVTGVLEDAAPQSFDLVMANIHCDLLIDRAGELLSRARPGGRLLLSGMPLEYQDAICQVYQQLGCRLLERRQMSEFASVLLQRGQSC
ncbi:SAM-dependent methyltransferase [Desulfuromonas versatilis]|uniref:SAM-dependent methyltransferase n=1 Tax=Desulfuromonas versatilis TaxID=2802975 RepID=A0ABM8I018_9BACT|nr:50S ribosomal protein L11 methyltransferase [Desulfuromonas versatilis]BCR06266.1 SAM-dependent methyltransferase [Desulfuromonas versatilis]